MALTMDPPCSSMGTGPLIFHGKPMEYFCKGMNLLTPTKIQNTCLK